MEETNEIKQNWNRQKQIGIFFSKKSDQSFFSWEETRRGNNLKFLNFLIFKFSFVWQNMSTS